MGARLTIEATLVQFEHRPAEDGGPGFISAALLPDGSRQTLEVWTFGDSKAGQHLGERFNEEGACAVLVVVEPNAKTRRREGEPGEGYLSTRLWEAVDADGVRYFGSIDATTNGRRPQLVADPAAS